MRSVTRSRFSSWSWSHCFRGSARSDGSLSLSSGVGYRSMSVGSLLWIFYALCSLGLKATHPIYAISTRNMRTARRSARSLGCQPRIGISFEGCPIPLWIRMFYPVSLPPALVYRSATAPSGPVDTNGSLLMSTALCWGISHWIWYLSMQAYLWSIDFLLTLK